MDEELNLAELLTRYEPISNYGEDIYILCPLIENLRPDNMGKNNKGPNYYCYYLSTIIKYYYNKETNR